MRAFAIISLLLTLALAGCGGGREGADGGGDNGTDTEQSDLTGSVQADGSSTVGPYTTAAAERFQRANPDVRVTVGVSGTGGGFERFCRGETDLSNASRPIADDEAELCEEAGVEYVEFQVANDALTVVANSQNDWADCLTVEQLKTIWDRGSKVSRWSDVDSSWPDVQLRLYGPGTDSGTFDYFTDEINGEEGRSRSDYSASEDDNVLVQGVAGNEGGLGYFGLSYFEQNRNRLKAISVDDGDGCIEPTVENAQNGSYTPLARPLFIYARSEALERPEVQAFIRYLLDNEREIAEAAQFVPMTDEQLEEERREFEDAIS